MKRDRLVWQLLVSLSFFSVHQLSMAKDYSLDVSHSNVGFTIHHLVSKVNGTFKDFDGSFSFDPAKPEASKLTAEVVASSVDTHQPKRDAHLQSEDFFNVKKFPKFTFVSKTFSSKGDKKYQMTGDLTMRGISKPVTFDVELLGEGDDGRGGNRIGFEAVAKVNRKDYGISWNKALDKGGFVLGEEVTINLNAEAIEKK